MRPLAIAHLLTATTEDHVMHHDASNLYVKFTRTIRGLLEQTDTYRILNSNDILVNGVVDGLKANLFVSAYSWHRVNGEVRFKRNGQ